MIPRIASYPRLYRRWAFRVTLVAAFGMGATAAGAVTLSWSAAIDAAAQNNAELSAARANVRAAHANERAARAGFFPQVDANVGYSHSNITVPTALGDTTVAGDNYSATVTASQNLFNGFQDQGRVAQAQANLRAAQASLAIVRARLSYDLKSAYAALLQAQRGVSLQENILQRREDNLRMVELRFQSGRENKGSVLLSQAYREQARYDLLQARNGIGTAQAQLARVLGRSDLLDVSASEDVPPLGDSTVPDFVTLLAANPTQAQARAQEDAARAAVTVARGTWYPSLSVSGSTGRQGADWFPDQERWSVGVNLAIPLFHGGRDYYGVRSAVENASAAGDARLNTERQLLASLKQAYSGFVEANSKLAVDESFVRAAEMRAEIARNKYNNGLLTFDEWDIIENDLINRQKSLLQTRHDRVVSEAAWEQAQGKGVLPDGT